MTFTQTRLVGNRMLVKGEDYTGGVGETILDTTEWDEVQALIQMKQAEAEYSDTVSEFYATITAAADRLAETKANRTEDPDTVVELEPAVEGVAGSTGRRIVLGHDATVLRLLAEGKDNRLLWVGDSLEVVENPATTVAVGVVDASAMLPAESLVGSTQPSV